MRTPEEQPRIGSSLASVVALAVYVVGVGSGMAVLSLLNEPIAGKLYPRGLDFGLELIALAWPLALAASLLGEGSSLEPTTRLARLWGLLGGARSKPRPSVVIAACCHWAYTFVVALVFLFPRQLLNPIIDFERSLPAWVGPLVFGLGLLLALYLLASSVVLGTLRLVRLSLGQAVSRNALRMILYAWTCGLAAVVPVAWLMTDEDPSVWLRPPATFSPELLGTFFIAGSGALLTAGVIAQLARSPTKPPVAWSNEFGAGSRLALTVALVAVVEVAWLSSAARSLPGGLLPPNVTVETGAASHGEVLGASEAASILRRVMARTGLDAVGETFRVRWSDASEMGAQSDRTPLADGTVRVRALGSVSRREQRGLLAFQYASTLAELRFWPLPRYLRAGFAYWAAEAEPNPFTSASTDGWSAQAACADVAYLDFFAGLDEQILAPSALPFVRAERRGGVRAAQDLLAELSRAVSDDESWRSVLLASCGEFLGHKPEQPTSALTVEVVSSPQGPPADGLYERRILNEAKRRAGVSQGDHRFVIRYAAVPNRSSSVWLDRYVCVVTINPVLTPPERERELIYHFVGQLVAVRYAGRQLDPFRNGYSLWANRDPENPFIALCAGCNPLGPKVLCEIARTLDLFDTTSNVRILSVLPFIDAESHGGERAAQLLFRQTMLNGRSADAWRVTVLNACASMIP